ncbi:hypothetical protein COT51_02120 [candidate division WWE3 bacterium CG08_land_8_20_14_0_20_41_15]|uniref:CopC domain-containing protein n=1 Tax=candidate division WWE3 bacterium CG08_land_8_20_14_0_20_41_15 TaxID=1975086 RepID=A0A2H0X9F0_UNCKA|nr:MAG: hypothetical protein COT51_02120 [candidate division WWE3 bacterium CG08_land_8_20_14_0_20_41_15]
MRKILLVGLVLIPLVFANKTLAKGSLLQKINPSKGETLENFPNEVTLEFGAEIASASASVFSLPGGKVDKSVEVREEKNIIITISSEKLEIPAIFNVLYEVNFKSGEGETGQYNFRVGKEKKLGSVLGKASEMEKGEFWLVVALLSGIGFLVCLGLMIHLLKKQPITIRGI